MVERGRIEILSQACVIGWAKTNVGTPVHVYASLRGIVLGCARADLRRDDLDRAEQEGAMSARAFVIVFDEELEPGEAKAIEVRVLGLDVLLESGGQLVVDRSPGLRVFILGSPRSGTSELGGTLALKLRLPWLGEGHAAPLFSVAADSLTGNARADHGIVRIMAKQGFRRIAIRSLKIAYYFVHASASFLDKTPGVAMIRAAPFLAECFPGAKFIYLRRNGISNVLSRMTKFGGDFDAHCADWAAAMNEWVAVRDRLPGFLEIEQEAMLANPAAAAFRVAEFLGVVQQASEIAASLQGGARERTGAGLGRTTLSQSGWSPRQIARFRTLCGPTMEAFSYSMEGD